MFNCDKSRIQQDWERKQDALRAEWYKKREAHIAGLINKEFDKVFNNVSDPTARTNNIVAGAELTINDPVNHPSHYKGSNGIECIDAIQASMTTNEFCGFLKGSVLKYLWRYENKGKAVEDLAKAHWFLEKLQSIVTNPTK